MFDLKTYLTLKQHKINTALNFYLNNESDQLIQAMKYSLTAGGKRLRPVLCLASAEAVGGHEDQAMSAACALEMIHTYSLIHDDLPAMDDDELRRGKATCHIAFDEATAILAGDALLTLAFEIISKPAADVFKQLCVIQEISKAAGYQGMVGGQMLDMLSEGKTLSQENLEQMHALKTGALIKASVSCGAILGGGTDEQIQSLQAYSKYIGLAFQVEDDILNVEGDPVLMGKAAGTDADRSKSTYPLIMGLENSKKFAKELIARALDAIKEFDEKSDSLRAVAQYIIDRKK